MPIKSAYSAGRFLLLLEGAVAGYLQSVEGGEPYAIVVSEEVGPDGIVPKHLGAVAFDPIHMSFGTGMTAAFYGWLGEFLNRQRAVRTGSIVFLDYNLNAVSQLEFHEALITRLAFPALDSSDKSAVSMTLTIQPETAGRTAGAVAGAIVAPTGKAQSQKALTAHNFRVAIDNLKTTGVSAVSAITISQPMPPGGRKEATAAVLDVGNLTLTVTEVTVKDFDDWFEDSAIRANPAQAERSGTIELLGPSLTPLFTLALSNLGIVRVRRERLVSGAGVIARAGVELYCESIALTADPAVIGSAAGDKPPGAKAVTSTERPTVAPAADGELVARRLLATLQSAGGGSSAPRREEGAALGSRWAAETASLTELEQIAALEAADWTALTLDDNHSLIAQLAGQDTDAASEPGPRDLARDAFVEGLVTGAARVLRSATPHLGRRPADG